jgi:predicted DNA-binding transcriptional regulator AlpA
MANKPLNVDEALAYLKEKGVQITKKTLYTIVSRFKRPKAKKIGRALRFEVPDLDDYVASITRDR